MYKLSLIRCVAGDIIHGSHFLKGVFELRLRSASGSGNIVDVSFVEKDYLCIEPVQNAIFYAGVSCHSVGVTRIDILQEISLLECAGIPPVDLLTRIASFAKEVRKVTYKPYRKTWRNM